LTTLPALTALSAAFEIEEPAVQTAVSDAEQGAAADVDAVVWNRTMMQELLHFIEAEKAAEKYRGLDWSVELRAAEGDENAIEELYQQFDIERYGAPGQKKETLI
jgi:hypothetical protein